MSSFIEKLQLATSRSHLCVGLDPVPERIPLALRDAPDGVAQFCEKIVIATAPHAAAYKPNLAFFEALKDGEAALERAISAIREHAPRAIIVGDGKRNDIGSTAQRYAVSIFERWGFDAVTVNPYLGSDGIKPFTEYDDRGVFLLCMTSNPSAVELQDHGDPPLYQRVAELAENEWNEYGNVGLVVGATRPERVAKVRSLAPSLPFLLPGVGAQGGDLEAIIGQGVAQDQAPGLVNSSRGILYASDDDDWQEKSANEALRVRMSIEGAAGRMKQAT